MEIVSEALTPERKREWEDFLNRCDGATFYHSVGFNEQYRHKCESVAYLIFRRGSRTVAGIPGGICLRGNARVFKSPFSASFAGFVFPSYAGARTCSEVVEALHSWCVEQGVEEMEIQQTPSFYGEGAYDLVEYALRCAGYEMSAYELCHVINLQPDPESLFTSSARAQYRQALSAKLQLAPSRDLTASYGLVAESKKKKGAAPSVPLEDYLALSKLLEGKVRTYSVQLDGQEIAVGVFYALSSKGLMTFWLAHRDDAQQHRPINFLICEVGRSAYKEGFRALDFGTTSDGGVLNSGLAHFKEGLGARPFLRRRFRCRLR